MVAIVDVDNAHFEVIFQEVVIKELLAHLGCVLEACTNGVHHGLALKLAPIGGVVDNDRRVDRGTILVPVGDVLVNGGVVDTCFHPVSLIGRGETALNTGISLLPVESWYSLVRVLGALLIEITHALVMDPHYVVPV